MSLNVSLSFEEKILNALAHVPHKRGENFMVRQRAEFDAIRKVLQPLYEQNAEISAHRDRLNKILRTLEGSELAGSCDWGFCDREADGWRRADDFGDFLPVCAQHMEAYETLQAQYAALVTA